MAIISANRYGRLNGNIIFAANESYGMDDIGRILQEEEMNEMRLFNAVILSDMHEVQSMREGTMLEAEIKAFQEASAKNFFKGLAAKLKAFWEKIKGVFKKAYANIAAFGVKYGTVWYKANKKEIEKLSGDLKVPGKFYHKKTDIKSLIKTDVNVEDLVSRKSSTAVTAADFNELYCYLTFGKEVMNDKGGLFEGMKNAVFEEITDGTVAQLGGVESLSKDITGASKLIKELQALEFSLQASVKDSIRKLEQAASTPETALDASVYNAAVSGSTTAISMIVRNGIKIAKLQMVQARKILIAALAASKKAPKVQGEASFIESMMMEAEEDVASMSDETSEDLTSEQQELVDAIIDAAEALKDGDSEEPDED